MRRCPTCNSEYGDEVEFCPSDGSALPLAPAHGEEADPLVGSVIGGKLRIERKLAEGGMGRVYEARHVRLGRRLAVKVLADQFTRDEQVLQRFQREAETAASLENPHIVEVIDIDRTADGRCYIVMELLEGEELRATVRRERVLPLDRVLRIFRQVASALDAAHARGIVHRDLKPENVFLCRREGAETVKIVDFGISKIRSADSKLTQTGAVMGTPYYMAPEQARGEAGLDHRADIYALGAILYELTTGELPSRAETATGILMKIILEDPTPPRMVNPSLPEAVEAVVMKAMSKDPAARFGSAGALVEALAKAIPASEATGLPATAPHRVHPAQPPHPPATPELAPTALSLLPDPPAAGPASPSGPLSVAHGAPLPPAPRAERAPARGPRSRLVLVAAAALGSLLAGSGLAWLAVSRGGAGSGARPGAGAGPDEVRAPVGADSAAAERDAGRRAAAEVEVLFSSEPPGAEVLRDGARLCAPTPCSAGLPARSGPIAVVLRAAGRRDATLAFETGDENMTLSGQLEEERDGRRRPAPDRSGEDRQPPSRTSEPAGSAPPSERSGTPGFASSPFRDKAPPGIAPAVVGNPFE